MEAPEKTNWTHFGYLLIIIAGCVFLFDFFYSTPSYESLERVNGTLEKHKVVRTPQGAGTHWLYIRSGDKSLTLCMPQFQGSFSKLKKNMDVWILGVASSPCSFQIWEVGIGEVTLIPYTEFYERENRIAKQLISFSWLLIIVAFGLIIFQRIKSNKKHQRTP